MKTRSSKRLMFRDTSDEEPPKNPRTIQELPVQSVFNVPAVQPVAINELKTKLENTLNPDFKKNTRN
jgi:hypothetical protein